MTFKLIKTHVMIYRVANDEFRNVPWGPQAPWGSSGTQERTTIWPRWSFSSFPSTEATDIIGGVWGIRDETEDWHISDISGEICFQYKTEYYVWFLKCKIVLDSSVKICSLNAYYTFLCSQVNHLVCLGGRDAEDAVKRQVACLLTAELQSRFNRTGRADPRGMANQKLAFSSHLEPLIKSTLFFLLSFVKLLSI